MGRNRDNRFEDLRGPQISTEVCLTSDEPRIRAQMETFIGSSQVTSTYVEFAPPWVLSKAIEQEYRDNWYETYVPVNRREMPYNAYIITYLWVYKINKNEEVKRTLKARLVIHGNHDIEKDSI